MKSLMNLAIAFLVLILTVFFFYVLAERYNIKKMTGINSVEHFMISEKEKCESNLPRHKNCKIVIMAVEDETK